MNKNFLCVVNLIFTLMFTIAATLPQALGEEVDVKQAWAPICSIAVVNKVPSGDCLTLERGSGRGPLGAILSSRWLRELRQLDLREGVSLATPARPETIADLYSVDPAKWNAAQRSIERINLRGRSLRRANFTRALMPLADLIGANLQGADLGGADLRGAILVNANLRGAILVGADLKAAILVGANLQAAILLGADLRAAELQVAQLHGVDLWNAQLQGANLQGAILVGANLRGASLYANSLLRTIELVDVRGLKWQPHSAKEVEELKTIADKWDPLRRDYLFKRLDSAMATANLEPATFESCLLDEKTEVKCKKAFALAEFRKKLSKELVTLACQSSYTAHGIMRRVRGESPTKESTTKGLATRLQEIRKKNVNKESCPGLFALTADDAAELTRLAEQENS
jgi:uncharacterized protein YjbI with pentapeptide repeats